MPASYLSERHHNVFGEVNVLEHADQFLCKARAALCIIHNEHRSLEHMAARKLVLC